MQYCAYRDRSQKEVEDKLLEMRMIPEACEQIVIKLMEEDFLNEERFARSFVRGKFRIKKWGRLKIKKELKQKEISSRVIALAFTEIEDKEYFQTLLDLAEKKHLLLKENNPFKKKKKLYNYLSSKGYESNLILEAIENLSP